MRTPSIKLTMITLLGLMGGCVRHEVTAPQLDPVLSAVTLASTCPTLAMPPVPDDVVIDIKGDQITANAGGETLLRNYSKAREQLR